MTERLSEFSRWYLVDPSRQKDLDVPVLIWEAPVAAPTAASMTLELTTGGRPGSEKKPNQAEPLVLPIRKGTGRLNAFGMGITLGRTDNNDLCVNDASVSRFHAYFQKDPKTEIWKVIDAESMNGSWLGPMKLKPNQPVELADMAKLRFGDAELTFMKPASFFAYMNKMVAAK